MEDTSVSVTPKFDLAAGKGTALGQFGCITSLKRGKMTKDAEAAIEPLHRFVYGRPGRTGERIENLCDFCGFPEEMRDEVTEKLKGLVAAKLRDLIKVLAMPVHVSQPVAALVDGVCDFLMCPVDSAKSKAAAAAAAKKQKRERAPSKEAEGTAAPVAKAAKVERAKPAAAAAATSSALSEDTVRVHVYRRVLRMTPQERSSLGAKGLRVELEAALGLADGGLKDFKEAIRDTASECVKALLDAETRAAAASPADGEKGTSVDAQ